VKDDGIPTISASLTTDRASQSRYTNHFRVAVADRPA
jgi:hypothetical protein